MKIDYYEILGIERSATQEEIKKTYKQLAMKYHPDTNDAKNAGAFFRMIHEAYEVLSDLQKRQEFDGLQCVEQEKHDVPDPGPETNSDTSYHEEGRVEYSHPKENTSLFLSILNISLKGLLFFPYIAISILTFICGMLAAIMQFALLLGVMFLLAGLVVLLGFLITGMGIEEIVTLSFIGLLALLCFLAPKIMMGILTGLVKLAAKLRGFIFG